ncbi:MAG: AMP-binding protein, partial [Candidatus Bathyarchaeales archaeon]
MSKQIPWYARKYKELGIDPDEIRRPEDLLKAYEKGLYTTPQDLPELVYYKHPNAKQFFTSGTSGKPKEVWLNPDDEKWVISQYTRSLENVLKMDDRILNCCPKEPAISGYMANCFLSARGYNFQYFPAQEIKNNIQKFIKNYKKFDPTVLMGLTTFMYRLPLILESFGIKSKLNSILVGAEPSTIERRKSFGKELEAPVYDYYA